MSKSKRKPLSCMYCEYREINVAKGSAMTILCHGRSFHEEIAFKWVEAAIREGRPVWLYMPYHCGCFLPRKVSTQCKNIYCKNMLVEDEWRMYGLLEPECFCPECTKAVSINFRQLGLRSSALAILKSLNDIEGRTEH